MQDNRGCIMIKYISKGLLIIQISIGGSSRIEGCGEYVQVGCIREFQKILESGGIKRLCEVAHMLNAVKHDAVKIMR